MTITGGAAVLLLSAVLAQSGHAQDLVLPFQMAVTERTENLPEYVSPPAANLYNGSPNLRVGWGIDSPTGFVAIDGETWVIFNHGNQYGTTVKIARYKGADFEHTERQPDGTITVEAGVSTHFCGGLWYDSTAGRLYAPLHCEYDRGISPPAGWTRKKTRLATSTDKGLTWHLEGDILTDSMPEKGDWLRFSGANFESGPADFDFYADMRGGYFYIFTCNSYAPKKGTMNNFLWFNEAARCAVSDRMAPGKWRKFCRGTWSEPGLGGKSSNVSMGSYGMYGRVMYSGYLHRYLRIGVSLGVIDRRFTNLGLRDGSIFVSTCDDLSLQNWSPPAKLLDNPGNDRFGFTVTDGSFKDPSVCDRSLHVYNYWLYNLPSRAIDVTFGPGTTPLAGFPRFGSYAYQPLPESGDTIVGRRTMIVGFGDTRTIYGGRGWTPIKDPAYFQGGVMRCSEPGASLQFSFTGSAIYWRAIADTDGGKVDVYLDGTLVDSVDCYYRDPLPYQFAYIRTGLDPGKGHFLRAEIRPDRNPRSSGTVIRHMAFEYAAESYRASAGFSAVAGRNNWYYRRWNGTHYENLRFVDFAANAVHDTTPGRRDAHISFANEWADEDSCIVGDSYQRPGNHRVERAWVAPHKGRLLVQWTLHPNNVDGDDVKVSIMIRNKESWPSSLFKAARAISNQFSIVVEEGDTISFAAERTGKKAGRNVIWDPVITYDDR